MPNELDNDNAPSWAFLGYTNQQIRGLTTNVAGKGVLSGITHPLYRASLRQVKSAAAPQPLTVVQAFRTMLAEGGMKALWQGLVPGTSREVAKTFIRGPLQLTTNDFAQAWFPDSPTARGVVLGVASGTIPSAILQPIERYKVYSMSQTSSTNVVQYIRAIWHQQDGPFSERLKGSASEIYRGYPVTAGKETVMNGIMFITMPVANKLVAPYRDEYPLSSKIAAASMSGSLVAIFVAPLDLAKTFIQSSIGPEKQTLKSALKKLYEQASKTQPESKKGIILNVLKRTSTGVPAKAALTFISYTWSSLIMGELLGMSEKSNSKPPSSSSGSPTPSESSAIKPEQVKAYLPGFRGSSQHDKMEKPSTRVTVEDINEQFSSMRISM